MLATGSAVAKLVSISLLTHSTLESGSAMAYIPISLLTHFTLESGSAMVYFPLAY